MKKNNVCIIVPSLKPGGLERVATILANYFSRESDVKVYMITLSKRNPFFYLSKDIELVQPPNLGTPKFIRILFIFIWLVILFIKIKPRSILSFGETYNPFIIAASCFFNHRLCVSNRASPLSSLKGIRGVLNPILYPKADCVIIQTKKAAKILQKKYKNTKFKVIANPIKLHKLRLSDPSTQIIINVGTIGGNKNQDWLINYFSEIKKNKGWKLYFIGDGPQRASCKQLAERKKVSKKVLFLGHQTDVDSYLSKSSIFAFTSTSEGFPNALAEAMAAGLAVIAYDCIAGPSDLIDDGINGFLIPEGNEDQYIKRLQELMNNEDLRRRFGEQARNKMKQFREDKIAEAYLQIIMPD